MKRKYDHVKFFGSRPQEDAKEWLNATDPEKTYIISIIDEQQAVCIWYYELIS